MAGSSGFVEFAVELLSAAGPVRARRMFGGHGLYFGEVMFGLVDDDELFLKTDDRCRQAFLDAGCRRWSFAGRDGRRIETAYYRPPDDAHDSPEAMRPWAERAVEAALRARAEREAKTAARKPRARGAKVSAKARGTSGSRRRSRGRSRS